MSESNDVIVIVASVKAKEGRAGELEEAFRKQVLQVQQEPGCLLYALHRTGEGGFVFIEKWASAEALETHRAARNGSGAQIAELIEGRPEATIVSPIPLGDRGAI
jgi:quinol monooxygenase YgiN